MTLAAPYKMVLARLLSTTQLPASPHSSTVRSHLPQAFLHMCHWRRVRNNYKRCGHYVDQPDDMVRVLPTVSCRSQFSPNLALRFNATIVTASSARRIPGTASHPAARRLAGSTASSPSNITPSSMRFAPSASSLAVLRV
ncbi:hypothetical protein LXA43DRAFT_696813 [Ganoderma leucocontextum]|nr:hypothetical protein LXA43DRAFT_696813 [Ganoderma leucocontextum]